MRAGRGRDLREVGAGSCRDIQGGRGEKNIEQSRRVFAGPMVSAKEQKKVNFKQNTRMDRLAITESNQTNHATCQSRFWGISILYKSFFFFLPLYYLHLPIVPF